MNYNLPKFFTPLSLSEEYNKAIFDVPIYQRLFAWRDEQVHKLMDDLLEASTKNDRYYIGILTIAVNNGKLDLIDGQQRMTVTTLMAIAFKELEPDKCAYWEEFLVNGNRLVFSARKEDSNYISARAKGIPPENINAFMERAISIIKNWCEAKKLDVKVFADYVWRNLTIFCSYLPENYNKNPVELNRYFEAMNSTGRQLKQHEILLVNLVAKHPNSVALSNLWQKIADTRKRIIAGYDGNAEEKAYARGEYKRKLANPDAIYSNNDNSEENFETIEEIKPAIADKSSSETIDSSSEMLISFEELLLMALAITLGKEQPKQFYQTDHLLSRFKEVGLKENGLLNKFFENLYKCRLLMDYKIVWQESGGDFDYHILCEDDGNRLEKFQSMLYVAYQNDFHRWLPSYIHWLIENPNTTPESELNKLKQIDRILHPCVPAVNELNYSNVERYWFWRLDYELWEHRNEEDGWLKDKPEFKEIVKRYVFRANRSIEHLHPQTPTDDKSEIWDSQNLNRFGNLAMISASFNSLQSNESAGVKMERIHHQIETSQLQSLKMLHMWLTYRSGEIWTIEKAISHEETMYSYIAKLYTQL